MKASLAERFWAKVQKTDTCWLWTASANLRGYGWIGVNGRLRRATRVAWELQIGEIPAGLHVLHTCDNPRCVRQDHLWLGNHVDNMRDMAQKGRAPGYSSPGESNSQNKLSAIQVEQIRSRYAIGGITQETLGHQYGVAHSTISAITRRENWK